MKERTFFISLCTVFALFTGYLFLHGEKTINSQKANDFTAISFQNNSSIFEFGKNDPSSLAAKIATKKQQDGKYAISYFINDSLVDSAEIELSSPGSYEIKPTQKVFARIGKFSLTQKFEYKIAVSRQNDQTDYIKKTLQVR